MTAGAPRSSLPEPVTLLTRGYSPPCHTCPSVALTAAVAARSDHRWLILVIVGCRPSSWWLLDAHRRETSPLPSAPATRLGVFLTATRQWVVTAYALAFRQLAAGRRFGSATCSAASGVFITGLAGVRPCPRHWGALPSRFGMLVAAPDAARAAFGAILAPLPPLGEPWSSTFREPHERGRAFGVFGSVAGGGGVPWA